MAATKKSDVPAGSQTASPAGARPALETFARFLPIPADVPLVTLGEGWTPLVKSQWLGPRLGLPNLWFKLEQTNPTGSYKDRFAALEVSLIRARGQSVCVATTSGNTGSALAAYCARAGIRCFIFLSKPTPQGKITQMLDYGAQLFHVRDPNAADDGSTGVMAELIRISTEYQIPFVISAYQHCPHGMEGVKTISYEIAEQLAALPGNIFTPAGGGGLCTAIARGFVDLAGEGTLGTTPPRIHAVQPALNDTIVTPWRQGLDKARAVDSVTQISGLAVQMDIDATRALTAIRTTGGTAIAVEDEFIWEVQRDLCRHEGIYVEPAGATSVAGLVRAVDERGFQSNGHVVCVLTGHGFKDPVAAERMAAGSAVRQILPRDMAAIACGDDNAK